MNLKLDLIPLPFLIVLLVSGVFQNKRNDDMQNGYADVRVCIFSCKILPIFRLESVMECFS